MKSPLYNKYRERLAGLNDQLCFFKFNMNELNIKLASLTEEVGDLYTTEVFINNDMAPKIHVKITELPSFQEKNQTLTFGSYISTSYEIVNYYLQDTLTLLQEINPATFQSINNPEIEEQYYLTLQASGITTVPRELIDTLKYLRLRRNHFVHLLDTANNKFRNVITNSGATLNTYWATRASNIDFCNLDVVSFEDNESIDILKVLRIITQDLDGILASNLSYQGLASFLCKREFLLKPQRLNEDIVRERVKLIIGLSHRELGILLPGNIIEPYARTVGKK